MKVFRSVQNVSAAAGREFGLLLDVLSAGGYEWHVIDCPEFLGQLGSEFQISGPTIGGEAKQLLKFKAEKPGNGILHIACKRPWDKQSEKTLTINVSVTN